MVANGGESPTRKANTHRKITHATIVLNAGEAAINQLSNFIFNFVKRIDMEILKIEKAVEIY